MLNSDVVAAIETCEGIALSLYNKAYQHEKSKEKTIAWHSPVYMDKAAKNYAVDPAMNYLALVVSGVSFVLFGVMIFFAIRSVGANLILILAMIAHTLMFAIVFMIILLPKYWRLQKEILRIAKQEWKPSFDALKVYDGMFDGKDDKERYKLLCIYDKFICEHFVSRTSINKMPDWVMVNVGEAEAMGISAKMVIGNRVVK